MAARIINMTIPEELIKVVDEVAHSEGRTRSEFFREAVRRYVENRRLKKKDASQLLSRLARLAVKGPNLSASELDKLLYGERRIK